MRQILMTIAAGMVLPAAPALADHSHHAKANGYHKIKHKGRYDERGPYHCKRDNGTTGTTGLIIGGAVGALVGHELDGGRDRTVGTILGAAGGALLGRGIDRGGLKCR